MSFRRKTYDGGLFGGSAGIAERGNSDGDKGKTDKYAPTKRTNKNAQLLDAENSPFVEEGDKDRYLITYADLITLLLGLFIILYAISNIDAKKYEKMISAMGNVFGSEGKIITVERAKESSVLPPIENLKSQVQNLIKENSYENSIRLEENERGITIHILDDILFPSGNATLSKNSISVLSQLAAIIKALPNDVRIEGHTDNVPISSSSFPSNWHLSVARALNTAYYLIENEGLSPDKVSIVGYSEYKPISTNETVEGRATNRRVDIIIVK